MDEKSAITLIASVICTEEIRKNPEAIVTGRDYFQVISFLGLSETTQKIYEWVVYFIKQVRLSNNETV